MEDIEVGEYKEVLYDLINDENVYNSIKEAVTGTFKYIEQLENKVKELEIEKNKLDNILKAGLNKEKQYCFNEDGNTGKCLGYGTFFDDEPCEYCKSCERLNQEK